MTESFYISEDDEILDDDEYMFYITHEDSKIIVYRLFAKDFDPETVDTDYIRHNQLVYTYDNISRQKWTANNWRSETELSLINNVIQPDYDHEIDAFFKYFSLDKYTWYAYCYVIEKENEEENEEEDTTCTCPWCGRKL